MTLNQLNLVYLLLQLWKVLCLFLLPFSSKSCLLGRVTKTKDHQVFGPSTFQHANIAFWDCFPPLLFWLLWSSGIFVLSSNHIPLYLSLSYKFTKFCWSLTVNIPKCLIFNNIGHFISWSLLLAWTVNGGIRRHSWPLLTHALKHLAYTTRIEPPSMSH